MQTFTQQRPTMACVETRECEHSCDSCIRILIHVTEEQKTKKKRIRSCLSNYSDSLREWMASVHFECHYRLHVVHHDQIGFKTGEQKKCGKAVRQFRRRCLWPNNGSVACKCIDRIFNGAKQWLKVCDNHNNNKMQMMNAVTLWWNAFSGLPFPPPAATAACRCCWCWCVHTSLTADSPNGKLALHLVVHFTTRCTHFARDSISAEWTRNFSLRICRSMHSQCISSNTNEQLLNRKSVRMSNHHSGSTQCEDVFLYFLSPCFTSDMHFRGIFFLLFLLAPHRHLHSNWPTEEPWTFDGIHSFDLAVGEWMYKQPENGS